MGIIEGALIVLAGIIVGRFLPARKKRKEIKAICGCGHHHSYHEGGTGACHRMVQGAPIKFYPDGEVASWGKAQCGCQHYSGPEPLPELYAREISS